MCLIWGVHINLSLFNVTFNFEVIPDLSKHSKSGIRGSRVLFPSFPTSEHLTEAWYKELNNKAAPLLAELQAADFQHCPWVLFPWSCGFLSTRDSPSVSVVRSNIKTLPGYLKDFTQFWLSHISPWKKYRDEEMYRHKCVPVSWSLRSTKPHTFHLVSFETGSPTAPKVAN